MVETAPNPRTYGSAPYTVAVVHGSPGAAGEMVSVAQELAHHRGILEPFQTATSVESQIEELRATLESCTEPPVVLIGFSWGAWLSYLAATRYPSPIRKGRGKAGGNVEVKARQMFPMNLLAKKLYNGVNERIIPCQKAT